MRRPPPLSDGEDDVITQRRRVSQPMANGVNRTLWCSHLDDSLPSHTAALIHYSLQRYRASGSHKLLVGRASHRNCRRERETAGARQACRAVGVFLLRKRGGGFQPAVMRTRRQRMCVCVCACRPHFQVIACVNQQRRPSSAVRNYRACSGDIIISVILHDTVLAALYWYTNKYIIRRL